VNTDRDGSCRHSENSPVPSVVVAQILGIDPLTLREWQYLGYGPRFVRDGTGSGEHCYYRVGDIKEWLSRRSFHSCSVPSKGGT
jgi:hypothetical protein